MKSAYLTLGIPGNASPEDIEAAFLKARQIYSPQRLAADEEAVERFTEVKLAYDILRKPDLRAAHDRKLETGKPLKTAPRIPLAASDAEPSSASKFLWLGLALVAAIFATGMFISNKNAEARKHQAAIELAEKKKAEQEEERQRLEAERVARERAQAKAKSEADDRRLTNEARASLARAGAEQARQQATALQMQRTVLSEAQRQESVARMEEQRNAAEARQRVEMDKRRIRELCYQQYRRYDC